ncbi:hypothetical protein GQR58_029364 [Nymphon striatum]|nr:hypothetical protein GQR58_029364 [Nymphon striatum]
MVDKKNATNLTQNIRGLVQDLSEILDARMVELRRGTPIDGVRPFDAKVFMLASRHTRSASKIAKSLGVSKQAVQAAVQRLMAQNVVELVLVDGNKKEKIVQITEQGKKARVVAAQLIQTLEEEMVEKIGEERLEVLRSILVDLNIPNVRR